MARYRLRFLLQEIDLPVGETVMGRSPGCHVTIEDPLVSRQHARVRVEADRATVEDLGSRNGLVLNGMPIKGLHELKDGDRIRIGTQELVFCSMATKPVDGRIGTRPTGFMCHCGDCGHVYPTELVACPNCGASTRSDEDTLSGVVGSGGQNWTLQLLVEVLKKASSLGRWTDVERMLRRARSNVEEQLAAGEKIDRQMLDVVADAAIQLAVVQREASWARWALDIHNAAGLVPSRSVGERLSTLPPAERSSLVESADRLIASVRARGGPAHDDLDGFARVESLLAASE